MEKYKNQPRWWVNVKSRTMRFTPYQADTAVVTSEKSRYDSLKTYQTMSFNPSKTSIYGSLKLEKLSNWIIFVNYFILCLYLNS